MAVDNLVKTQVLRKIDEMKDEIVETLSKVVRIQSVNPLYPGVEWILHWPSYELPPNHPIVQTVSSAYEEVKHEKPHPQSSVAVTDANFLVEKGIPAIDFGPGETIETAHAANEYLKIDDLTNVTKILALSILNWCRIYSYSRDSW